MGIAVGLCTGLVVGVLIGLLRLCIVFYTWSAQHWQTQQHETVDGFSFVFAICSGIFQALGGLGGLR